MTHGAHYQSPTYLHSLILSHPIPPNLHGRNWRRTGGKPRSAATGSRTHSSASRARWWRSALGDGKRSSVSRARWRRVEPRPLPVLRLHRWRWSSSKSSGSGGASSRGAQRQRTADLAVNSQRSGLERCAADLMAAMLDSMARLLDSVVKLQV